MYQNLVIDVFENLQNFILLKQQNLVIFFWMTLKKHNKKISLNNSKVSSKAYSFKSAQEGHMNSNDLLNFKLKNTLNVPNKLTQRPKRFTTEYITRQQDDNYLRVLKPVTSQMPLIEKKSQAPREFRNNYYHSNHIEQLQLDNSDEFQDIVLDRLSKLESNINKLMKSRRTKESQYRSNMNHTSSKDLMRINDHMDMRNYQRNQINLGEFKDNGMRQRKKKFFDSLQNAENERVNHNNNDAIYNMKYIPTKNQEFFSKKPNKSRRLEIQVEADQDQDILEDIEYFNQNNLRKQKITKKIDRKQERHEYEDNYHSIENSNPSNRIKQEQELSKDKGTSELYINRYKMPQTTKNNRIHYMPNDLQMQTVVQYRRKYNRKRNNADGNLRVLSKTNNVSLCDQDDGKSEHESLNNYADYNASRNNNLTTLC